MNCECNMNRQCNMKFSNTDMNEVNMKKKTWRVKVKLDNNKKAKMNKNHKKKRK